MSTNSDFSSYSRILLRRWWLFVLLPLVTVASILLVSSRTETEYLASERLQIGVLDTQEVALFGQSRFSTTDEQITAVHDDFWEILRFPTVAWRTIADLGLDMSAEEFIGRLDSQHLNDFIVITLRMSTPELAQQAVTRHVDNAITTYRDMRTMPARTAQTFLEAQMAEQAKALAAAEKALQDFQLQNEVSNLDTEILAQQELKRQVTGDRDRAGADAARNDRMAAEYLTLARQNTDAAAALEATLVVTETTPTPSPDFVAQTRAQIDNLRALAARQQADAQSSQTVAEGQRAAMAEYGRQLDVHEQEIVYLLGLQEKYRVLVDNQKRAENSFAFLTDKADEARLRAAQGQDIGYLQVIEPPRLPDTPFPKRTGQFLVVGLVVSILLALILAFVFAYIENSLGRQASAAPPAAPRQP